MKKIGIFATTIAEENYSNFNNIILTILEKNIEVFIFKEFAMTYSNAIPIISKCKTYEKITQNFVDFVICIGGDGTFLKCSHLFYKSYIPIVGINLGKLGFLAEIMPQEITMLISKIENHDFTICKRSLLEFKAESSDNIYKSIGLNEITLQKSNHLKLLKLNISINNNFLYSFWADGVIISTPTGSTGYSLSLGGPIITPDSNSLVITPIAPHSLNVRPIIIPDNSNIRIEAAGQFTNYLISNDFNSMLFETEPTVTIKKSIYSINTLQFNEYTFFDVLRKKLQLGIDIRK